METYFTQKSSRAARPLSRIVIGLHERGYSEDFFLREGKLTNCADQSFALESVSVTAFNYVAGGNSGRKFLYTVETDTGLKGILISENNMVTA